MMSAYHHLLARVGRPSNVRKNRFLGAMLRRRLRLGRTSGEPSEYIMLQVRGMAPAT